eukprot:222561-Rhodomonas_salina.1
MSLVAYEAGPGAPVVHHGPPFPLKLEDDQTPAIILDADALAWWRKRSILAMYAFCFGWSSFWFWDHRFMCGCFACQAEYASVLLIL